ncbi:MAG: SpoIIE family protein phosphatase [Anaerolineales bacterium]|nr:SpoIIE family protein phosphatase [Anaerolineales bacterium]
MVTPDIDAIKKSLVIKRENLTRWLKETTHDEAKFELGPLSEREVQTHLETIDHALRKAEDGSLGICEVCQGHIETELLEMNYTARLCLDDLSEKEKRLLEYELELSQAFWKALLPQETPQIPGMELAVFSQPAQIVGGDYFDFPRFPQEGAGLAIADAAGKGISASMVMGSLKTALNALVPSSASPAEVLQGINRLFVHNIHMTTFITIFLGCYHAQSRTLAYSSAGHNPPLLVRPGAGPGEGVRWLNPTGAAIGLVEEGSFTEARVQLQPGDRLLLYTDGVTEATNTREELFGTQRLEAFMQAEAAQEPKELVRRLRQRLDEFSSNQPLADDTTFLVCAITE